MSPNSLSDDKGLGRPGGLSSQATEPEVSALRASIPDANDIQLGMLEAIQLVLAGDYPKARGIGSAYAAAHGLGLLVDETQMRPCKTCGTPRPDFTYPRVTLAGQAYYALAQAIEARRAETQSGSVEDESAVGNADAPNSSRGDS